MVQIESPFLTKQIHDSKDTELHEDKTYFFISQKLMLPNNGSLKIAYWQCSNSIPKAEDYHQKSKNNSGILMSAVTNRWIAWASCFSRPAAQQPVKSSPNGISAATKMALLEEPRHDLIDSYVTKKSGRLAEKKYLGQVKDTAGGASNHSPKHGSTLDMVPFF
ncbi:hypothetical protein T05_2415 [Trichinella murrelli]|uniref:Uncharacterized protein n=1 Tax=Trichinella murrelli TaxID=144512 RepID=A0A0V0UHR8_9BILA|nr:hypothetical protein T05_2415 [Trichinella murrelli]